MTQSVSYPEYPVFLAEVKARIQHARLSAGRAVNRELILLYWDIGQEIVTRQERLGWGESVIDRLAADICAAFSVAMGFSPRNLRDMKRLYLTYSDEAIWRQAVAKLAPSGCTPFLRQLVAEIPWGHNLLILTKLPAEFKGRLPTRRQLTDAVRAALPKET